MNRIKSWLIRRLVPKCDICGKPAYYEHFPRIDKTHNCNKCEEMGIKGWIYVCWECSMEHEGHAPIW